MKGVALGGFPGGSVAKTLSSQCWGLGFDPWSGNQIPHATTKSLHATTKIQHSQININKYFFKETEKKKKGVALKWPKALKGPGLGVQINGETIN